MAAQIGVIDYFTFNWVLSGWLKCDGSQVEISQYPDLHAVIGTQFDGDGSTYFQLPDLSGNIPAGYGSAGIAYQAVAPYVNNHF
jgi:microcystin-dependent protein